jgi:anti-anti-sigma factor
MKVTISHTDGDTPVTILRLEGTFDANQSTYFLELAEAEIESGAENLLLDFSQVPFMSSAGVRVIYSLYNSLHPKHSTQEEIARSREMREGTYVAPHLKILKPNMQVLNVMRMVGIDSYIELFNDEAQALSAFGKP